MPHAVSVREEGVPTKVVLSERIRPCNVRRVGGPLRIESFELLSRNVQVQNNNYTGDFGRNARKFYQVPYIAEEPLETISISESKTLDI